MELATAEAEAKNAKRGLWMDKAPVPSWEVTLPHVVVFPSVTYRLMLENILAAGRHELTAHDQERGRRAIIGPSYYSAEALREEVFVAGGPVRPLVPLSISTYHFRT